VTFSLCVVIKVLLLGGIMSRAFELRVKVAGCY